MPKTIQVRDVPDDAHRRLTVTPGAALLTTDARLGRSVRGVVDAVVAS